MVFAASRGESDRKVVETETLAGICRVVDGDDIEISGLRVRLHGIADSASHVSETTQGKPRSVGSTA